MCDSLEQRQILSTQANHQGSIIAVNDDGDFSYDIHHSFKVKSGGVYVPCNRDNNGNVIRSESSDHFSGNKSKYMPITPATSSLKKSKNISNDNKVLLTVNDNDRFDISSGHRRKQTRSADASIVVESPVTFTVPNTLSGTIPPNGRRSTTKIASSINSNNVVNTSSSRRPIRE